MGSDQISHLSIKYASARLFTPYEGGRSLFFVEVVVPPEGGGEDDVRQDAQSDREEVLITAHHLDKSEHVPLPFFGVLAVFYIYTRINILHARSSE